MIWCGPINEKFLWKLLAAQESTDHHLFLCSEGGDTDPMLSAGDVMAWNKWGVTATGCVMSAAIYILAAGTERAATENTRFMIHCPWMQDLTGNSEEIARQKAELDRYTKLYFAMLGRQTKHRSKWWKDRASEDWFFGAKEALQYGLIHTIA